MRDSASSGVTDRSLLARFGATTDASLPGVAVAGGVAADAPLFAVSTVGTTLSVANAAAGRFLVAALRGLGVELTAAPSSASPPVFRLVYFRFFGAAAAATPSSVEDVLVQGAPSCVSIAAAAAAAAAAALLAALGRPLRGAVVSVLATVGAVATESDGVVWAASATPIAMMAGSMAGFSSVLGSRNWLCAAVRPRVIFTGVATDAFPAFPAAFPCCGCISVSLVSVLSCVSVSVPDGRVLCVCVAGGVGGNTVVVSGAVS